MLTADPPGTHRASRLASRRAASYKKEMMGEHERDPRRSERGQAMTEYVILLFGCMLALLTQLMPMANAIHNYMKSIYFCVSLPFP